MTVREDIIDDLTEMIPDKWPGITKEIITDTVDRVYRRTLLAKDLRMHTIEVMDIAYNESVPVQMAINKRFKTETENVFSI